MVSGAKRGEEKGGRDGGHRLFQIPGWGAPRAFLSRTTCPKWTQGKGGQGRANPGHSSGPGKSHDCSVFLRGRRQRGAVGARRRREVNRRPQREPVPCAQRTPAASGPRWVVVCVEMKPGGEGREGRVSTHFSAVIHPPRFFPPRQPTLLRGEGVGGRRSRSAHPQVRVAGSAFCESDTVSAARHLRSGGERGGWWGVGVGGLGLGRGEGG